jgi:GGDEF domain-containing protein
MYGTIGFMMVWLIIDNIILLSNRNISDVEYTALKEELKDVKNVSELLRRRFVSAIELTDDGMIFREEEFIFGTDKFVEYFDLKDNQLNTDEFDSLIVKDDRVEYRDKLEKLTRRYPTFTIKYRVKNSGGFRWIQEHGKLLIIDKKRTYISTVRPMDLRMYPKTDVDVLNNLADYRKMMEEMQRLTRTKNSYHLVLINLTNIPKINEKFGRDFGDLMMGEYLSKLRFKFIKDRQSLFRISGIKYGMIIKDSSKFNLMSRALVGQGELFNLNMKFGGVSQTLFPNLGISECPYTGKNAELVYEEANNALQLTYKEDFEKSFSYHTGN